MSAPNSLDVLLTVGELEAHVASLADGEPGEVSVTILFPVDGSTVSLTFTADRFLAFVGQLRQFAATMPGRPLECAPSGPIPRGQPARPK